MKKIEVSNAVGMTLCHDITAIFDNGFKGVLFKRGHVIEQNDIDALLEIGKNHIFVWEPGKDEVHEEDAALALSNVICDESIESTLPSEGKITLRSKRKGLFCVNEEGLLKINMTPDYTVACIKNFSVVNVGDALSGVRIVPLVTKRENVDLAVNAAQLFSPVFSVLPFIKLKVGLIITGSEIYYGRIEDKFEPIMRKKLKAFDADFLGAVKCPDDLDIIKKEALNFIEKGADIVLFTGGMSVDPDDLTPTAIRDLSTHFVTQGIPMQPGNMLTIAYRNNVTLVGVPGASLHSKVTSLDVFLPRIFAGLKITKEDTVKCGLDGLCLNCKECHFPNCNFSK